MDYTVSDHGSLFLVLPRNTAAEEHLKENVDECAMWFGPALAVEHGYIVDLVEDLREQGYGVEVS